MTRRRPLCFALICSAMLASQATADDDLQYLPAGAQAPREAVTPDALNTAIASRSAQLFDAIFTHCQPDTVADAITADFEFHHDRWGTIATSRTAFVDSIRGQCERRHSGEDTGSGRELVDGTQTVFPAGANGAIETGIHRFHIPKSNGGETLVGIARYSHLWRREDGVWRVSRILSYDHRDVR